MAKYIFTKPYTITAVGTVIKTFLVGDIYDGTLKSIPSPGGLAGPGGTGSAPPTQALQITLSGDGTVLTVPLEYVKLYTGIVPTPLITGTAAVSPSTTFFTPKNIIIGLVGIGLVLGFLKYKKII